jgi:3'-5' exoribonuclease
MKYLKEFSDGDRFNGIYFCKSKITATTKNGKTYFNVTLQDKSGTMDAKIWDVKSDAINEFDAKDYIDINAEVSLYNGSLQAVIRRLRVAGEDEYNEADYLPTSRYNNAAMYESLLKFVSFVEDPYYSKLLNHFFVEDTEIVNTFKKMSAAKSIHHGFIGGLLEHTLGVARLCQVYTKAYTFLNRDLLLTAALLHDIGKLKELSLFPENDYTDEGQLLGHISIGVEMIHDACKNIEGFPLELENQLKHCILAHHGELEFGSPKKPALVEAVALSLADLTDARMESFREILDANSENDEWFGFNRIFDSNLRKTRTYDKKE